MISADVKSLSPPISPEEGSFTRGVEATIFSVEEGQKQH